MIGKLRRRTCVATIVVLAMIAYVLAGPDGTAEAAVRKAQAAPEPTPA